MKAEIGKEWNKDELEALREILLQEDREAITYLAKQIALLREQPVTPEALKGNIRSVLGEVMADEVAKQPDKMISVWQPIVIAALERQIKESPQEAARILRPIMGSLLRSYIPGSAKQPTKHERVQPPPPDQAEETFTAPAPEPAKQSTSTSKPASTKKPTGDRPPAASPREVYGRPATDQPPTQKQTPTGTQTRLKGLSFPLWVYVLLVVVFGACISIIAWWFYNNRSTSNPLDDLTRTVQSTPGVNQNGDDSIEPTYSSSTGSQAEVAAAQAEINRLLLESPVLFSLNQDAVPETSRVLLDRIAAILKQYSGTQVEIHVYTDSIGPTTVNQEISQTRADAITLYLSTEGGISPHRLIPIGRGEENPVGNNSTPSGRRLNRRAEFEVQPWQRQQDR